MRTWTLASQKGGSGCSTLAVHLAVLAEAEGETVGIIDLDPQASVYEWHEVRGTNAPNVFPGTVDALPKMIDAAATLGVTLTLIDTPSKVDATVLAAIRAADLVIMPTRAGLFDVAALKDTVKLLVMTEKLPAALAVINNFDPSRRATVVPEASAVLEGFGIAVSSVHVPHRPQFETALKKGRGVTEAYPKSVAAEDMRGLWGHLDHLTKAKATASKRRRPAS
jgi:chromosome partitioning protein